MSTLEEYINIQKDRVVTYRSTLTCSSKAAKLLGDVHYIGNCKVHGEMLFLSCDNSCPVCCKIARESRNKRDPGFNRSRSHYNEIKKRSIERFGVSCEFSLTEFRQMLAAADTCPALLSELNTPNDGTERTDFSKSVDRFNPMLGYTKENTVIISDKANRIKNNGSPRELLLIAIWMFKMSGHSNEQIQKTVEELL